MQRVFKAPFLVMMSLVVALLALAGSAPASARTFVSVGIGVGPYWRPAGYYGPYWHDPYWRWRSPYWAPYPVVYAPYYAPPAYVEAPPAYVAPAPAPAVVQAPPPPVQAGAAKPAYDQANCREYTSTITVAGRPSQQVGTACQQPDGSWRIVN
ncbi:hypothetical protein [Nitrospirillum sp. BR 11163]|uniref:hypothetical protein n=1 Tax=Nitrospirillum sp. BR 11163 TaxID=3104323 RepID=UPI002AFF507B|nr:hypothetical protein [Nitrospirillum sp. BR 11163]MEA1674294.1 hypothetical protein [Nitrospirillum sp. BR 11163]